MPPKTTNNNNNHNHNIILLLLQQLAFGTLPAIWVASYTTIPMPRVPIIRTLWHMPCNTIYRHRTTVTIITIFYALGTIKPFISITPLSRTTYDMYGSKLMAFYDLNVPIYNNHQRNHQYHNNHHHLKHHDHHHHHHHQYFLHFTNTHDIHNNE